MRSVPLLFVLGFAYVVAAGCATTGVRPGSLAGHTEVGQASYYAAPYHGRATASGERFDTHKLTAAHRTLPFGTRVRVTNLDNGRTVEVRITDRGPFVEGRAIDLSRAAAGTIGLLGSGVGPVRIEVLAPAVMARAEPVATARSPAPVPNPPRTYVVEVGRLRDAALAARLRDVLAGRFPDARVAAAPARGDGRYRVQLGPFQGEDEARAHAERVTRLGYPASLVEDLP